jgi:hypothetical protein
MLVDGLYDVTNERLSAGFMVYRGQLVWCAPILRKRFDYWQTQAAYLMPLSNLPGPWEWKLRGEKWWRVHRNLNIEDGPHDKPRCHQCGLRIAVDLYGGADAWVHLSDKANRDHMAEA